MIETCRRCGVSYEHTAKRTWRLCTPCNKEYMQEAMERHRLRVGGWQGEKAIRMQKDPNWLEKNRARGRQYWKDLRHAAMMRYGGYRCRCCGETEPKFLTLDHIHNDGSVHRKKIGNRGAAIFKWLKDHEYPAGFQVLCMNCNHGKAMNGGICPHQDQVMKTA